MNGADDQQTAETARDHVLHAHAFDYSGPPECCGRAARAVVAEVDRLRAELETLRRRAGHCNGRPLDPACGYCGAARQCERCEAIAAQLRLRAELADTRAAGDALADAAYDLLADADSEAELTRKQNRVGRAITAWRAAG